MRQPDKVVYLTRGECERLLGVHTDPDTVALRVHGDEDGRSVLIEYIFTDAVSGLVEIDELERLWRL